MQEVIDLTEAFCEQIPSLKYMAEVDDSKGYEVYLGDYGGEDGEMLEVHSE